MSRKAETTAVRWMTAVFALLALLAIGLIGMSLRETDRLIGAIYLCSGIVGLIVVASTAMAAQLMLRRAVSGKTAAGADNRLEALMAQINEHAMLSDNAKRVLYRDRELELIRHAIEHDISNGDYNAGLALCDELADVFGYRQEAEAFRSRIIHARHEHYEASVHAAMEQFDALLIARDWARAHQEAARIRRLFPDSHVIQELDARIMAARDEHKHELERLFLDAAQREDVEQAMSLLKQLDRYLNREEAGRLTEAAQEVVTKHRKNLEVQFKLAVNDRRWTEALRIGESIIGEFPNTKMADEVRGMLTTIRTRAGEGAVAAPNRVT